jgi:GTP pyrophosphokinase
MSKPVLEESGSSSTSWGAETEATQAALEEFLSAIRGYLSDDALETVRRAFQLAQERHRPQSRASGEPYILHPIEVAAILAGYKLDVSTLAATLLHDTVEDTNTTLEEIEEKFGGEVRMLVDGVTKLTAISARQGRDSPTPHSKQMAKAENLRKIFLAMAKDLRVILIKLADRLHNLRTLGNLRPDKQKRIASETLEIFTPIASRLGVFDMKCELEDLCFRYLFPEEFEELEKASIRLAAYREEALSQAVSMIEAKLRSEGIPPRLEWREKHLYSTFRKMERTGRTLEEVYDLVALRIVVPTVGDCYTVLGVIHSIWIPMKDRIKDYIAVPKSNNYRSLHTTIFGPKQQPLEIQIRTEEMHQVNEMGIAAHWAYKEGAGKANSKETALFKEIYPWIRAILDWQTDSRDAREYIENLKVDLLQNEVFVFTPKGEVVDLPAGCNPIDFAYRIHTEVGHRCVGAKVNGKMVPLTYILQNADIVEIVTAKNGTPSLDWLRICKSNGARNKIRAWFKKEKREENIVRGRDMLRRELGRQRMDNIVLEGPLLARVSEKLNFQDTDDLLASLGYGETTLPQVLGRLRDELPKEVSETLLPTPRKSGDFKPSGGRAVEVVGIDNILIKFARCCAPVPGDPIRGYITLGKGVSVHVAGCVNLNALLELSPEREIEVRWDQPDVASGYHVDIELEAWDRDGLLSDVMGVINEAKVPTRACKAWTRKDTAFVKMTVDIKDKRQLEEVLKRLRRLRDVVHVSRVSQKSG